MFEENEFSVEFSGMAIVSDYFLVLIFVGRNFYISFVCERSIKLSEEKWTFKFKGKQFLILRSIFAECVIEFRHSARILEQIQYDTITKYKL